MTKQGQLDFAWRREQFGKLVAEVRACRRCARMQTSERVLNNSAGSLDAQVMFIGEAPGRLGADASHIPFHGDKSGENFERLLEQTGLTRYDTFVTNAVLCNPKDSKGNNATPTPGEIENCSGFLRRQFGLVEARTIVTLGTTALRATRIIEDHGASLESSVRSAISWNGRVLIPAYHPGQRAVIHRSFANQLADFRFIANAVQRHPRKKAPVRRAPTTGRPLEVAKFLLRRKPSLSYFALHKLFYLAEVQALKETGRRMTEAYVIRQKDGPYFVDLHLNKLKRAMPKLLVTRSRGGLMLAHEGDIFDFEEPSPLSESDQRILTSVVVRYGDYTDQRLKTRVYLSTELKEILRKERKYRLDLLNVPMLIPQPPAETVQSS